MQLYALDQKQQLISADQATKQIDYICLECQGAVRLRAGPHRKAHFFHFQSDQPCRLNGKSMVHLQVQFAIQEILPDGECYLEYHFPKIHRIADVVWIKEKIVFEIQCSPISQEEVALRNRDYISEGYQVVWILHEARFNQWRLSAAEMFLRGCFETKGSSIFGIILAAFRLKFQGLYTLLVNITPKNLPQKNQKIDRTLVSKHPLRGHPFYYTNIDADGRGCIYDQFDLARQGIRTFRSVAFPVEVNKIYRIDSKLKPSKVPFHLKTMTNRLKKWPFYFSGDLLYSYLLPGTGPSVSCLEEMEKIELASHIEEKSIRPIFDRFLQLIKKWIVEPYRLILQFFLEKSCR